MNGVFKDKRNIRIGKKVELPRTTSIFFSYVERSSWQMVYGINALKEKKLCFSRKLCIV